MLHHGGDLSRAEARFGRPLHGWLDLSTGINPRAYANLSIHSDSLHRLPQSAALNRLVAAAREYYHVPAGRAVLAAPGSQAILQSLTRIWPAGTSVAVVSPTYEEHPAQWERAGHRVTPVRHPNVAAARAAEILILTNPNNPDGYAFGSEEVQRLVERRHADGRFTILDEAFADCESNVSIVPAMPAGCVVLRSVGKFFGLAGLRLGFAIGQATLVERLAGDFGPWPVSGPALEIGHRALTDTRWITATQVWLEASARRLDELFGRQGLGQARGTNLFRLIEHQDAAALHDHLGRHGILCRSFDYAPGWLRFGLPGNDEAFTRLETALRMWAGVKGTRSDTA